MISLVFLFSVFINLCVALVTVYWEQYVFESSTLKVIFIV